MEVDPIFLEILACPCEHHARVELHADAEGTGQAFLCMRCGSSFPVRDGIPVMLVDEANPGPRGIGAQLPDEERG